MKKNLLRRFFATSMLFAITTLTWAYDFAVNKIYYNKNSDGTSVTVTYKTTSYNSYSGSVAIPSQVTYNNNTYDVTSIGESAFRGCSGLTSITIPNSVTSIGESAFYNCSGLTSVTIGNSVTSIGSSAFSGCSGLTSVTIPNSVTSIGESAFYYCSGLTSVTIPNSVTSIGNSAFYKCSGLTSVTIPNSVKSIGESAFYYCSGLTSVTIGYCVTKIQDKAFANCEELMDVYCLARKVPTATTAAFEGSYPEYITLHVMSSAIKDYKATAPWSSFGSIIAISGEDPSPKIQFADAAVKAICVDNWDVNGDGDLSEDEAAQVTSIGQIFRYNSEITSFNELQYFTGLTSIGEEAFYNCTGMTSMTIPNSVTSIGKYAFLYCSGLTSVTIPNSVTSIGESAFYYCSGLTSVTIPNSVTSIGYEAFYNCSGLTKAEFASIESLCNISFGDDANPLYYAKHLYINGQEVTDLVIPNTVTSIGNYAFRYCSGLTSVTIPNSVTSIGYRAFEGCSGLTSVTIPNSVTSIGNVAFSGCSGLTSVTCLAKQVPTTETNTFYNSNPANATLYVPASALEDYKNTAPWSSFGTIVALEPEYIVGDANGNGEVEIGDVTSVLTLMATPEATGYNNKAADANGNGEIEIGDVTTILTIMANGE